MGGGRCLSLKKKMGHEHDKSKLNSFYSGEWKDFQYMVYIYIYIYHINEALQSVEGTHCGW